MGAFAIYLLAVGVADLVRGPLGQSGRSSRGGQSGPGGTSAQGSHPGTSRHRTVAGAVVGVVVILLLGSAAGLPGTLDNLLLLVGAAALVLWVWSSGRAATAQSTGQVGASTYARGALLALAAPLAVALLFPGGGAQLGPGALATWLGNLPGALRSPDGTRTLLVLAAFVVQLSTANVIVRFVLTAVGALKPAGQPQAADRLRGGRLIGPMERVVILGLGLTGNLTAAGLVIAAKGLIRFPELQAGATGSQSPGVDEVTEYFLVGSMVSWLLALGTLALSAMG